MKARTSDEAAINSIILPLVTAARAEEVEQRIRQAILLGLLPGGQQFPPETVFASQLGVSPMTLRDALLNLRQQGLVETRRGRTGGTFVRRWQDPLVPGMWERLRQTSMTALRDLTDEQSAVAGMSARLAAERASDANVRRLRSLVAQLANADNLGSRIRADSRFHVDLAVASQSERLMRREVSLQGEVGDLLWLPYIPEWDSSHAMGDHLGIAMAVADEDGERARYLAEQHVRSNFRRLTELHHAAMKIGEGRDGRAFKASSRSGH